MYLWKYCLEILSPQGKAVKWLSFCFFLWGYFLSEMIFVFCRFTASKKHEILTDDYQSLFCNKQKRMHRLDELFQSFSSNPCFDFCWKQTWMKKKLNLRTSNHLFFAFKSISCERCNISSIICWIEPLFKRELKVMPEIRNWMFLDRFSPH